MSRWNALLVSVVPALLPGWVGAEELVDVPVAELIRYRAQGVTMNAPENLSGHAQIWGETPRPMVGLVQAIAVANQSKLGRSELPWPVLKERAADRKNKACVADMVVSDSQGAFSRPLPCSIQVPERSAFRKELARLGYAVKVMTDSADSGEAWPGTTFQALYGKDGKLRLFMFTVNDLN